MSFKGTIISLYLIIILLLTIGSVFPSLIVGMLNIDITDYEAYYAFIGSFILIFMVMGLIKRNKYMMEKVHFKIKDFLLGLRK